MKKIIILFNLGIINSFILGLTAMSKYIFGAPSYGLIIFGMLSFLIVVFFNFLVLKFGNQIVVQKTVIEKTNMIENFMTNCSFCGIEEKKDSNKYLVIGPGVSICSMCAKMANHASERREKNETK